MKPPSTHHFGEYSIDPLARELRRAGSLLTVSPKVFDCIIYLIEHRERAVGRDELIAAVWGKVDVADVQLRHLMRKVRRAIGDSGDGQTAIRTIPGFGFRWVAGEGSEPSVLPDAPNPQQTTSPTRLEPGADPQFNGNVKRPLPRRMRIAAWVSVIALAALVLGTGLYGWHSRSSDEPVALATSDIAPAQASPLRDLVAVLPVDIDAGGRADSDWMRLGLMDLVANQLRHAGMNVAPSSDIVALIRDDASAPNPVDRARAATGARDVITSSLSRTRNEWTLRLALHGDTGTPREVETRSVDAIVATREAADQLLDLFGKRPPTHGEEPSDMSATEIVQRMEAALLVDDFDSARRLLESVPPVLLKMPEVQLGAARIDIGAGNIESARARLETLLANASPEASPVFRARVLNHAAAVGYHNGRLDIARQQFTESLALLENRNEPTLSGQAWSRRGGINVLQGRYDDAKADFARARTAFDLAGNTLDLAVVELNEGSLEAMRNRPAQALPLFERAAQHSEAFGSRVNLVHALGNQLSAYLDLLQPAKALAVSERIDRELPALQDSPDLRIVRYQQIPALLKNGHIAEARDRLDDLLRTLDPIRETDVFGMIRAIQAEIELTSAQWQEAAVHAKYAVGTLSGRQTARLRSDAWLTWVRALRELNRSIEAEHEMQRFSAWARTEGSPNVMLHAYLAEAEQAGIEGNHRAAYERYADALRVANEGGVPADIATVVLAYGATLVEDGELERAGTVIGQIAPWADTDFECAVLQARFYHALGRVGAWSTAIHQARALAGERALPPAIMVAPKAQIAVAEGH